MRAIRLLASAIIGLSAVLAVAPSWAQSARVTFLLVNDIYQMTDTAMPDGRVRGGFARLAAVVKAERARARDEGRHVVFAHGGDTLSPSLMSGFDRGAHIIALTNMIPPDIFAPGNHEFDFGPEIFAQRMREAKFPIYAANLRGPDGKALSGIEDRRIVTLDGVRIGLTGIAHDQTPRMSTSGDLKFLPTVATAREQAETLRREGADFVVAVAHADRRQGYDIVATRAVDLVLTGHNHDLFINYDGRNAMVESSYDAHYVVAIDVTIHVRTERGERKVTWWPQFRVIDTATVTPDPDVAAAVAKYEQDFSRELDVPIATTAVELDSRNATVRTREAAIGNLIADALRLATRADAAVMNGGGIRAGRIYPPGSKITRRDVMAELPFNNRVVPVEIKGSALRAALENGLSALPEAHGKFPQISGMAITVDLQRPPGSRIVDMTVGGAPLDPEKLYKVAIQDFLARGGDGYVEFRDAKRLMPDDDAPLVTNEVIIHLRVLETVTTGVEGRIVFK
jgi:2',3'-cyclic-nucleotide 2'-phosphodiesterase (5'-nucleotidase family)